MTFKARRRDNTSQSCLEPHASACEKVRRCSNARDTHKTEKNVRETRCSLFTPRRVHDSRQRLYAKSVEKLYECARIVQSGFHIGFAKSLQPSLFPPLGDLAIESLEVRVATIVVRMMKRKEVATSRFSNFDPATPVLLAMLHRMVFALLSRSFKEVCRPCFSRRVVSIFVVGLKSVRALIGPGWR